MGCLYQYNGQWYSEGDLRTMFDSVVPSTASSSTIDKMKEFLARIGVEIKELQNDLGLNLNGIASPLKALVEIAYGKEGVALTEEAAHMAVELIQLKNPKLFKEMMNSIGSYNIFSEVFSQYRTLKEYQTADGKPDVAKIKKEAIGKILAQTIINQNEGIETPAFVAQSKSWWTKIVEFLKALFNRAEMNPFEEAAAQVLNGQEMGNISEVQAAGTASDMFQVAPNVINGILKKHRALAQVDGKYEFNGQPVRNSVLKDVADFIRKKLGPRADAAFNAEKIKNENLIKADIKDIIDRYVESDGSLRSTPLDQTNPSQVNATDNTYYSTLENHIKDRLASYPPYTKFFASVHVINEKTNTAGTIDLLAIGDKVDILQFKVPDLSKGAKDIPLFRQEGYNIEIEALRKILVESYGIKRTAFDRTRALPIKVEYKYNTPGQPASGLKMTKMSIGNVDTKVIQDDILFPVPSVSESSGNKKLDTLLKRLRGLVERYRTEERDPSKAFDRAQRIGSLLAAIRKLSVKGNADELLSVARTTIKREDEKYIQLTELIKNTDPDKATLRDLDEISNRILEEKNQIEIYSELHKVFNEIFTDGTEDSKKTLDEAKLVSETARDLGNRYLEMSYEFRTKRLAVKMKIDDELDPEKELSWNRRMIRSLSQSSIKAGHILWNLVKRINNTAHLEFQDRLATISSLEEKVSAWLSGKNIQELYSKIFAYDEKGRWTGRVIQKIDRDFYKKAKEATEARDLKWIKENIDVPAYEAWYLEEHKRRIEASKTARYHENDAENAKRVKESLQEFVNTFSLRAKTLGKRNWKLRDFPRTDIWESKEYTELKKPGNEPVLELYNYYVSRLEESFEVGMISDHNGWSFFPNVRKNALERFSAGNKGGNKLASMLGSLRVESEDIEFGKLDPVTNQPIDTVHANFVSDLANIVQDTDGKYFTDYGEKSQDIFKVIALWDSEIAKFKARTETENIARLLAYTEENRTAYKTGSRGRLKIDRDTNEPIEISNETNFKYIKEHIDSVYYGRTTANDFDVTFDIPFKRVVEKVNKLVGREVIDVPADEKITISGIKALSSLNRFFVSKTLGLNVFTSIAQLFGGTANTLINAGRYFDKADVGRAELRFASGRFWGNDESKKIAGLLAYFDAFAEDRSQQKIRGLSVSNAVKYLSSDHLFVMQRASDTWVNSVINMAMIENTLVINGQLVNARVVAKDELNFDNKYSGTPAEAAELAKKIDERVEELKAGPTALVNVAQIVDDKIVIPGVDRLSDTVIDFRQTTLEVIKNALGNTSREDLSLYKRSVMWQSFFMFKNWIPRMADVRFQSFKFSPGTDKYEWGRMRMLGSALRKNALGSVKDLLGMFGTKDENLINRAKQVFEDKRAQAAEQREDFTISEAEFIDSYIKGVKTQFKELILALAMMGILAAARAYSPDKDESYEMKGAYKWLVRGLDKLTDELSFFYNPISFTSIVNGSLFPAVGILVDVEKFLRSGIAQTWFYLTGDEEGMDKTKVAKHVFKIMPISKELLTYLAIFNQDLAKDYGLRVSSNSGSIR